MSQDKDHSAGKGPGNLGGAWEGLGAELLTGASWAGVGSWDILDWMRSLRGRQVIVCLDSS